MTGKRAAPKSTRLFRRSRAEPTPEDTVEQAAAQEVQPAEAFPGQRLRPEAAPVPVMAYAGPIPATLIPDGPPLALEPPPPVTPSGTVVPAGNPSVLPSGAVPLGSRALARHERRRRNSRLRIVIAGLLAMVLVVAAVMYVAHRGGGTHKTAPAVVGPNNVILLEVTDNNGASGVALLGDQHGSAGAVVLVPPGLAVDAEGGGVTVQKAASVSATAAANGVSDALGIKVSGTWTLTSGGLAALVDRIGGVDADVDVNVREGDVIKVQSGQQHLDGVAAAAYSTYAVAGEPAQAQLARLDTVLEAVIGGLSDQASGITAEIAGLGASSQSTLPVAQLGTLLAHLHALDASSSLVYRSLPVHELDASDGTTYTVDSTGAAEAISDLTGLAPGSSANVADIRVLIRNGVGTPGLGETARAKLAKAGDVYVAGGNQLPFDKDPTVILISEDTPSQRALGDKVAAALGVPDSSLRVSGEGQSIADVVAVLGTDYHP